MWPSQIWAADLGALVLPSIGTSMDEISWAWPKFGLQPNTANWLGKANIWPNIPGLASEHTHTVEEMLCQGLVRHELCGEEKLAALVVELPNNPRLIVHPWTHNRSTRCRRGNTNIRNDPSITWSKVNGPGTGVSLDRRSDRST
jgi:hypothetical protein